MMRYVCPDGHPLQGTLETMRGLAQAEPKIMDGRLVPEYGGYTEVFWDEQRTITQDGEDVWICSEGDDHLASTLKEGDVSDEDDRDTWSPDLRRAHKEA